MRNVSNTAKFFIVCAVVFGIGLLATAIGAAAGGIEDFGKVAEKREWIQGDPGKKVEEYVEIGDFDSVEIKGCADVNFMTEKWSAEDGKPGRVKIVRGSKVEAPDVKVEKGVLYIDSPETEFEGISVSLSDVPRTPGVFVYCTEKQLEKITAESTSGGDLSFMGIRFKKADIRSDSGDVFLKGVRGETLNIKVNSGDIAASGRIGGPASVRSVAGDIRLSGKFLGETEVDIKEGDFSFETTLAMEKYAVDAKALAGDVRVTASGKTFEYDEENNRVDLKGGPNSLTVQSLDGDIELVFR